MSTLLKILIGIILLIVGLVLTRKPKKLFDKLPKKVKDWRNQLTEKGDAILRS